MTYSIVVTILLIIITALFISAIRNAIRDEARLERKQFVYYKSEVVGRIEFRHGKP